MRNDFQPAVYILASQRNGTIYTGVTSALALRIQQHRDGRTPGFTSEYGVKRLVWFELHDTMDSAILLEKRIKKWKRAWKLDLIEAANPEWRDLAEELGFEPLQCVGWVPAFAGMTIGVRTAKSGLSDMGGKHSLTFNGYLVAYRFPSSRSMPLCHL